MMAIAVIGAAPAYADNLHGFGCGTTTAAACKSNASSTRAVAPKAVRPRTLHLVRIVK